MTSTSKRSIIPCRLAGQLNAARVEHLQLEQLTFDVFRDDVITNPLEHLAENQISEPEALTLQLSVNPIGLGIRDAAEVVDPNGSVDDHDVATRLFFFGARSRDRLPRPPFLAGDECSSDCESE